MDSTSVRMKSEQTTKPLATRYSDRVRFKSGFNLVKRASSPLEKNGKPGVVERWAH